MSVVVAALYRTGEAGLSGLAGAAAALPGPLPLFAAAGVAAAGANAVNNLPMSLGVIHFLRTLPPDALTSAGTPLRDTLAFGALLGVNLGPCITVTGSLATMLCLAIARRQGVAITPLEFVRVGALVTLPTLLAGTLATALLLR
jgi:arsenical pump membrane protein